MARNRYGLLLRLSTHANGDGTFLSLDGERNFSPSMDRLESHYASRSLYRHMDDLRDLGLLSWERENHYGRRVYKIKLPGHRGNLVDKPKKDAQKHLPDSQKHLPDSQKHLPQLRTPSVFGPSLPTKERKTYGADAPNSTNISIKTEQQKRYGIIGRLAGRAEFLLKQDAKLDRGDLAELLKEWAARSEMPYFWPGPGHSPIEQAIVIAEAGLAATGAATPSPEKTLPPSRAIDPGQEKRRRA